MKRRIILALLITCIFAAGCAGCGSKDSGAQSSGSSAESSAASQTSAETSEKTSETKTSEASAVNSKEESNSTVWTEHIEGDGQGFDYVDIKNAEFLLMDTDNLETSTVELIEFDKEIIFYKQSHEIKAFINDGNCRYDGNAFV